MAKISTKTFNPMAGVSIPGWAIDSYKTTASDLGGIVDSLTDAYNKQQDRDAALGLEAFQMDREQENFESQFEYQKNQDSIKNDLNERKNRREAKESAILLDYKQQEFDANNDSRLFSEQKSTIDSMFKVIPNTPEGINTKQTILDNLEPTSSRQANNFVQASRDSLSGAKKQIDEKRETIRSYFFDGLPDEELALSEVSRLKSYVLQSSRDPKWAEGLSEMMLMKDFDKLDTEKYKGQIKEIGIVTTALMEHTPGSDGYNSTLEYLEGLKRNLGDLQPGASQMNFLREYSTKTGLNIREVEESYKSGKLTDDAIQSELTGENKKLNQVSESDAGWIEGIGDYVSGIFSGDDSDELSTAGKGLEKEVAEDSIDHSAHTNFLENIGRYESREDAQIPTISRYLGREDTDLSGEFDKMLGAVGGGISDLASEAYEGVKTIGRYASRQDYSQLPNEVKKYYNEFASNHPNMAKIVKGTGVVAASINPLIASIAVHSAPEEDKEKVRNFAIETYNKAKPIVRDLAYLAIDKTGKAMQAGVDYGTEKFTGAIEDISKSRAVEVLATSPHRFVDFFNQSRNVDIDKYINEGMNYTEATDRAYKDAVDRGGSYFASGILKSGEGAPSKMIYKKHLVDYAPNLFKSITGKDRKPLIEGAYHTKYPSDKIKNAPSEFVNPRWIAWETNNLEKRIYEQYANVTDSNKQEPNIAARSMKNIKNKSSDIVKELRKLKLDIKKSPAIAKGDMTVKEEVIDKLISQALRLKNPKDALKKYYEEFNKYKFSPTSVGTFNMSVPQDTSSNTMDMMFDSFLQQN
jgi:hypothetical protein